MGHLATITYHLIHIWKHHQIQVKVEVQLTGCQCKTMIMSNQIVSAHQIKTTETNKILKTKLIAILGVKIKKMEMTNSMSFKLEKRAIASVVAKTNTVTKLIKRTSSGNVLKNLTMTTIIMLVLVIMIMMNMILMRLE